MNDKQALIIELLRQNPQGLFGLEMIRLSDGKLGRATIYIHLGVLEEEGIVEPEDVPQPSALSRPRYRLTPKGSRIPTGDIEGCPQGAH